jgi:hypothetical protein
LVRVTANRSQPITQQSDRQARQALRHQWLTRMAMESSRCRTPTDGSS